MNDIILRAATPEDATALLEIYAPYVRDTAITFEYDVPTVEEFRSRIAQVLEKYPYILAEQGGKILGYAYAHTFYARAAYDWSAETAIYLRKGQQGRGLGKRLYGALEALCKAQGITNLNACIAVTEAPDTRLNNNSRDFHAHLGYTTSAAFHKCGYKFNTWYDMIWMEKHIGEHAESPRPVIPFTNLDAEILQRCGLKV